MSNNSTVGPEIHTSGFFIPEVQFVLGCMTLIMICDFVSRLAACIRIGRTKSAVGLSAATVLANISASFFGIGSEILRSTDAQALTLVWAAPLIQTAFGIGCNAMLLVVMVRYTRNSRRNELGAVEKTYARNRLWYLISLTLFGLFLAALIQPFFGIGAEQFSRWTGMDVLPGLADLYGGIGLVLSALAWFPQSIVTWRTPQPATQHWLYAGISALGPFVVAGYQLLAGASWSIWLASVVPGLFALLDVILLCVRMRKSITILDLADIDPNASDPDPQDIEMEPVPLDSEAQNAAHALASLSSDDNQ